jgi:hypothetical protein
MNESEIENVNINNIKIDRLPMNLRMPFQIMVFEMMGIQDDTDRVLADGKIISDYIDNEENVEVRELIKARKFEEAAVIVINEIKNEENFKRAA